MPSTVAMDAITLPIAASTVVKATLHTHVTPPILAKAGFTLPTVASTVAMTAIKPTNCREGC